MAGEESLGDYLRREREAGNITLKEVAEVTRIHQRYLAALEADEFGVIPAEPLVKGFLRAYARHVGLDADEVVARYVRENQKPPPLDLTLSGLEPLDAPKSSGALWSKAVLVVLFIAVGASSLWFMQRRGAQVSVLSRLDAVGTPKAAAPERPSLSPSAKVKPPAPEVVSARSGAAASSAHPAGTSPRAAPAPASPTAARAGATPPKPGAAGDRKPRQLRLRVQAIEDTWLRVAVDDQGPLELLLTAGASRSWAGKEKFVLTVGNAAGTRLSLNGVSIKLPPTRTNVVHDFVITPKALD